MRVLDLFAGTGAFGCEALSRGADSADFVDHYRTAINTIRENLRRIGCEGRVLCGSLPDGIKRLAHGPWDLIFLDPPYDKELVAPTIIALIDAGALAPGATVVAEHSKREDVPAQALHKALTHTTTRTYGDTCLTIWEASCL